MRQSMSANRVTAPTRITRPISAGARRAVVAFPVIARSASAVTGRASFMKLFHTPVVEMRRAISEPVKPHERNMATTTPMAIAPPPGTRLEMVVPVWLLTAA